MTLNEKLRVEAERRRAVFFQTASSVSDQLRPSAVLDKVVGVMDPNFEVLKRIQAKAQQNPFAILVAVGGLWLLTRQLKRNERPTKSATRRSMRVDRMTRSTVKGDENGYINTAEQH